MADYQLRIGSEPEVLTPVQTLEVEGHEQSCLFDFPETMPGQLALQDGDAPADGSNRVS